MQLATHSCGHNHSNQCKTIECRAWHSKISCGIGRMCRTLATPLFPTHNISFLDEPVQYTDRPNSTEVHQELTTYVYPVEQEFWEVEDLDDPQASQTRWRHLYTQLNLRSSENPPSQSVARMYQHRPLNRFVLLKLYYM